MSLGFGPRVERPAGGYGTSPAFDIDTPAGMTLAKACRSGVESLVCGSAPLFEDGADCLVVERFSHRRGPLRVLAVVEGADAVYWVWAVSWRHATWGGSSC